MEKKDRPSLSRYVHWLPWLIVLVLGTLFFSGLLEAQHRGDGFKRLYCVQYDTEIGFEMDCTQLPTYTPEPPTRTPTPTVTPTEPAVQEPFAFPTATPYPPQP